MNTTLSPLIHASDVAPFIQDKSVVIVDARGGADALSRYEESHLMNATFADLETDLSQKTDDAANGGRHPLPDTSTFGITLGKLGISPDSHVLVYDDKAGANAAARLWWMLRAAGHSRVQVIDGGLASLVGEGLPIVSGHMDPITPQGAYPIKEWRLPLADMKTVDRLRNDADHIVVDVREPYRYQGESEPIDLVAGHIPGAVNIPYLNNLDANGIFRSPEALADQYRSIIGGPTADRVIVHCGSGVTACHTLLALEVAGIHGARLYPGSWSEWSRNQKPVSRGKNP